MTERTDRIAALRAELAELERTEQREAHERLDRMQAQARTEHDAKVDGMTPADLVDPDPQYRGVADYVLPFGREYGKWSALDPESHPFGKQWLGQSSALICKRLDQDRTRPTRIIHTSGVAGGKDRIGNVWEYRHDQTGARLGEYEIVGVVVYGSDGSVALVAGDVPATKMSLSTYK